MVQPKNRRLVTESALELFIDTQAATPVATIADLPAANASNRGLIRFVTAENEPYYSNGTAWSSLSQGAQGEPGPAGAGVPAGGEALQIIQKNSVGTTTEWVTPTKSLVGLSNVDNTADADKPVSTMQQLALDEKASKSELDQFKPESGTRAVGRGELVVSVKDFGAKGDNSTDDLPAFNAAFAELVARGGGELYIPAGKYRLSDEWDIYRANSPRRDIVIRGESQWTTFILSNFYGAGKSLIKSRDPLGATRCSPTSLMNLQLGTVSRNGPNPVLLDIYGHGESRLESIRFGSCNNSHMSLSSLQNVRMRDIVSFYGGKHFNYKNTAGIVFTSVAGSTTLTASAPVFSGTDLGRQIMLMRSDGTRAKYRITNYTDPQTVSISGDTPAVSISNAPAVFEPARITTTAGSNQVSANAQCFTADDIGRVIYIWGAANGPWGPALLRGRITELVSGATVKLDVNADISLTRTEFAAPVVDIYTPSGLGTINADSNDVKIDLLHIENYAGVGLVVESSVFMHIDKMKIHGEHAPTDTFASLSHMWLDDYSGTISGELDGAATGDHRIGLCNMNDMLTFTHLSTRQIYNEKTFQVGTMTNPGGIAEVKSFNAYAATANADPYLLVDDPNADPRLLFTGLVNMLGDNLPPRIYSGKNTYFTKQGEMVTKSPDGTAYKINVDDGGTITASPA